MALIMMVYIAHVMLWRWFETSKANMGLPLAVKKPGLGIKLGPAADHPPHKGGEVSNDLASFSPLWAFQCFAPTKLEHSSIPKNKMITKRPSFCCH
ncbi:hypothetical protein V6N12_022549 [Hibiscus sabdariffa]|uniref:Uncharacterized protein n=1 Tax=Hibiscus sabdariffa TaxID=183260 RepID=A0ABR2FV54_9ROSI